MRNKNEENVPNFLVEGLPEVVWVLLCAKACAVNIMINLVCHCSYAQVFWLFFNSEWWEGQIMIRFAVA